VCSLFAKDILHVQLKGTATIALANSDGKIVLTKTINHSGKINVGSLAKGIYYLQNKTTAKCKRW